MHKTILIKDGFPYYGTEVSFEKSMGDLKTLLRKFGVRDEDIMVVGRGTQHSIAFKKDGQTFLIEFPVTYVGVREKRLDMRPSGRIVFNRVKALLVDLQLEYLTFTQAMMPYLAIADESGRPVALQDRLQDLKGRVDHLFLPVPGGSP